MQCSPIKRPPSQCRNCKGATRRLTRQPCQKVKRPDTEDLCRGKAAVGRKVLKVLTNRQKQIKDTRAFSLINPNKFLTWREFRRVFPTKRLFYPSFTTTRSWFDDRSKILWDIFVILPYKVSDLPRILCAIYERSFQWICVTFIEAFLLYFRQFERKFEGKSTKIQRSDRRSVFSNAFISVSTIIL